MSGGAKRQPPVVYIYLDGDGIESLYTQTTDRLELEFLKSRESGKAGTAHGHVGLGAALKVLLGIDVSVGADATLSHKGIEQTKSQLSVEHKLKRLIEYLRQFEDDRYFEDLTKAANQSRSAKHSVFVYVKSTFDLPQFKRGGGGVEDVNRIKALLFETPSTRRATANDSYDASDDYFKRRSRFIGSASLEKFTRVYNGLMTATGHDGIMLRASRGTNAELGVFGYVSVLAPKMFQLKPYAIWL